MQEPVQSLLFDLLKSMDNFYKADTLYSSLMPALSSLSSFSSFSSLSSIWVWQWRRALASHFIFRVAKVAPSRHRWHCSRLHKLPTVQHLHSCTVPHPAFAPQLQLHHNCPVPQYFAHLHNFECVLHNFWGSATGCTTSKLSNWKLLWWMCLDERRYYLHIIFYLKHYLFEKECPQCYLN